MKAEELPIEEGQGMAKLTIVHLIASLTLGFCTGKNMRSEGKSVAIGVNVAAVLVHTLSM